MVLALLALIPQMPVLQYSAQGPGLAVALDAPSDRAGALEPSAILERVSSLVAVHTDFEMSALEAPLLRSCSGKLACIVLAVRRDYDRLTLENADGTMRPFEEHVSWLDARGMSPPAHLLVLTHFTQEGMTERLSLLLIDTTRALRVLHEATAGEEVEPALVARSVILQRSILVEDRVGALEAMESELRSTFEETGHWDPFGEVEVRSELPGATIAIGGVGVGRTEGGGARIVRVPIGLQRVVIEHDERAPFEAEVEVHRGASVVVEVTAVERFDPAGAQVRSAVLWSGLAVAVAGVAISIVALVPRDTTTVCVHSSTTECDGGSTWTRFGAGGDGAGESGNGHGPPILPLGLALTGMGAAWSLGTFLFGDEDDVPWIQLAAGVALFGATFGVMVAVDGADPF
jgi:hypothetical protein